MKFIVTPGHAIAGDITVPGDKSISHRAVLLSSLSYSIITLNNLLFGTDVLHTVNAMRALGVKIDLDEINKSATIFGVGLFGLQAPKNPIDCGNSGTLMRLLTGILVGQKFNSLLIGDESLSKRPMLRIAEPLRLMGAKIQLSKTNTAPIEITGNQTLRAIDYDLLIPSAQVKSAILLAGLYADGKTVVHEKIKTRDHTERMIEKLFENPTQPPFEKGGRCGAPGGLHIPGDISSAAFFIVLATITKNAEITIRDVGINPFRTGILDILKLMDANIEITNHRSFGNEPIADLVIKYARLKGIMIPNEYIASAIDEFPIIFIAAACAAGKTILRNASELRVKESDRIAVMVENLKKLSIDVLEFDDGVEISGGIFKPTEILDAKGDHRVAMALAIAGQVAKKSISIDNCDLVKTSFPNFIEIASQLGMNIREIV